MKEFSDNATFSDLFGQLGEMMKGGEKESGNEGSARRREVQERLRKQKAEKDAKKAAKAGAMASGLPTGDLAVAAALADANANALLMEEGTLPSVSSKKTKKTKLQMLLENLLKKD
jgi:hypothetical protein